MDKPLLIYDGDCTFCKVWIGYWRTLTGDRIDYAPYQEVAADFPQIPYENFEQAVQLVYPDGTVYSGAECAFESLREHPRYGVFRGMYDSLPGFRWLSETGYDIVARNRDTFYKITDFLFGTDLTGGLALKRNALLSLIGVVGIFVLASKIFDRR